MVEYRKSLDRLHDIQRGIKYETENARRKALEEGRAEGRAEAIAEKIKKAKEIGISDDVIAMLFGNDKV